MVSHHPTKFEDHKHYNSGDIKIPANTLNLPQMGDVASVTVHT